MLSTSVLPAGPLGVAVPLLQPPMVLLSAKMQRRLPEQRFLCVALLQTNGQHLLRVAEESAQLRGCGGEELQRRCVRDGLCAHPAVAFQRQRQRRVANGIRFSTGAVLTNRMLG
jgi:hypothetical protein